jgi:hypothetical protein
MFAAEVEPAETGRRRYARAPVSLDADLGLGGLGRALCKVVDLSRHGARLQTYSALKRGATVWLTLPGLGARIAEIMWADDFAAGCQFRIPLTDAEFEQLVTADR